MTKHTRRQFIVTGAAAAATGLALIKAVPSVLTKPHLVAVGGTGGLRGSFFLRFALRQLLPAFDGKVHRVLHDDAKAFLACGPVVLLTALGSELSSASAVAIVKATRERSLPCLVVACLPYDFEPEQRRRRAVMAAEQMAGHGASLYVVDDKWGLEIEEKGSVTPASRGIERLLGRRLGPTRRFMSERRGTVRT